MFVLGGVCVDWNFMKENGFSFVEEIFDAMGWTKHASLDGPMCINWNVQLLSVVLN